MSEGIEGQMTRTLEFWGVFHDCDCCWSHSAYLSGLLAGTQRHADATRRRYDVSDIRADEPIRNVKGADGSCPHRRDDAALSRSASSSACPGIHGCPGMAPHRTNIGRADGTNPTWLPGSTRSAHWSQGTIAKSPISDEQFESPRRAGIRP